MTATDSTAKKRAAQLKAWRNANKERLKAYDAARYVAQREHRRAKAAANYKAQAETYKQRAVRWKKLNPLRRYEIVDKWRKEHPECAAKWRSRDWEKNKQKRQSSSKEFRSMNPQLIRDLNKSWRANHPEANAHHVGLRRTRKMEATPAWADLEAIRAIYRDAARLKRETGEKWHVDHVVPLRHPLVCGLHVHTNLRVIRAVENQAKGNRLLEG